MRTPREELPGEETDVRIVVEMGFALLAWALGAWAMLATGNDWLGVGLAVMSLLGYDVLILRLRRHPSRRRQRQEAYDATPEGRLTRHH